MTKVLVTGCAGYIGSKLIEETPNWEIVGLDNLMWNQEPPKRDDFTFVKGDLLDKDILQYVLKDVGLVIHTAALVGMNTCNRLSDMAYQVNIDGTYLLRSYMRPDQKLIFLATNSGYGKGINVTEESKMTPLSIYARTKCEAEKHALDHKNAVSLRLATVHGLSPRMRYDLLVNDMVSSIAGTGVYELYEPNAWRSIVHIKDVIRAIKYAYHLQGVYNVVGQNVKKQELAYGIRKRLAKKHVPTKDIQVVDKSDPDKRDYSVSAQRLAHEGFRCAYDWEDTVKQLIPFLFDKKDGMRNY